MENCKSMRLSRNLNLGLPYAWHALNYSVMLPVVLVSSCDYLFISRLPLQVCKFF